MLVILDMIDVQQRLDVPVLETFTRQRPVHRIDIVRSVWNDDMQQTRRALAALAARAARRATTAAPVAVGS